MRCAERPGHPPFWITVRSLGPRSGKFFWHTTQNIENPFIHNFLSFWPRTVPYMTPTQFFALYLNLLSNLHTFFILCMNFYHFHLLLVSNVSAKFQQSFSKFSTMFQQCSHQKMQTPSLFRLSLCKKSIIFYLFFIFQQCFNNVSEMFKQFFSIFRWCFRDPSD